MENGIGFCILIKGRGAIARYRPGAVQERSARCCCCCCPTRSRSARMANRNLNQEYMHPGPPRRRSPPCSRCGTDCRQSRPFPFGSVPQRLEPRVVAQGPHSQLGLRSPLFALARRFRSYPQSALLQRGGSAATLTHAGPFAPPRKSSPRRFHHRLPFVSGAKNLEEDIV